METEDMLVLADELFPTFRDYVLTAMKNAAKEHKNPFTVGFYAQEFASSLPTSISPAAKEQFKDTLVIFFKKEPIQEFKYVLWDTGYPVVRASTGYASRSDLSSWYAKVQGTDKTYKISRVFLESHYPLKFTRRGRATKAFDFSDAKVGDILEHRGSISSNYTLDEIFVVYEINDTGMLIGIVEDDEWLELLKQLDKMYRGVQSSVKNALTPTTASPENPTLPGIHVTFEEYGIHITPEGKDKNADTK